MLVLGKIQNYPDFDQDRLMDSSSGFVVSDGCKAVKVYIISKEKIRIKLKSERKRNLCK